VLLTGTLSRALRLIRTAQSEQVRDHISALIHQKSTALDLGFYETPEYHDRLHRARTDGATRPLALLENTGNLLQSGVTLGAMAAVLVQYGFWLPVALLISTLPAFYVALHYTMRQHDWRQRVTALERRTWYYDWLLTARETAAELRLYQRAPQYQSEYQTLRRRVRDDQLRLTREQTVAEVGAGALTFLTTGGVLAWMLWRALRHQVTLGDVALFWQAFSLGKGLARSLLDNAGQMYSNSLFLGNLFDFLALKPTIVDPPRPRPVPAPLREGIRFHGVTFHYPGSARATLSEVEVTFPAGRIAAIVGANGAGKSTLVKLLCRFYDPESGRITLDRIDLRDLSLASLHQSMSVLFQQPVHYSTTVAENIGIGAIGGPAGAVEIDRAARLSGADVPVARMRDGYATQLGGWFGGAELSGGEWQRIALARTLLRQAPIIVLDEPTSAMDSWAEAAWLEGFRAYAAGRVAVIITHRFTTAMHAHVIHVMEEGRIVESGSHGELVAKGGRYAESWLAQTRAQEPSLTP
jgi:ATP-binding cassette subfamily B protein